MSQYFQKVRVALKGPLISQHGIMYTVRSAASFIRPYAKMRIMIIERKGPRLYVEHKEVQKMCTEIGTVHDFGEE